jgi:NAD(P)H dehydrogenase (quinone)
MILVTGAAGKTGRAVIRALATRGEPVRALVHHARDIDQARTQGAMEATVGDMRAPEVVTPALEDIDAVYLICPNMVPDEFQIAAGVIDAALKAGVRRLVYHSVLHPQTEAMPHHWQKLHVEARLFESGSDWTILQPAPYMQNLRGYWEQITRDAIYQVPYPIETRFSLVDLGDVAQAAATVLSQAGHVGAIYELCGPQVLDQRQIAHALSRSLGRQIEAQEQTVEAWLNRPSSRDLDDYQRDVLQAMFRYYADHGLWGSPTVLAWLLGRPPASLSDVLGRSPGEPP